MDQWLDLVNMVMNLRIPLKAENILSSWVTINFSRSTLLQWVSYLRTLHHDTPFCQDVCLQSGKVSMTSTCIWSLRLELGNSCWAANVKTPGRGFKSWSSGLWHRVVSVVGYQRFGWPCCLHLQGEVNRNLIESLKSLKTRAINQVPSAWTGNYREALVWYYTLMKHVTEYSGK
jgi:hypothetical protein